MILLVDVGVFLVCCCCPVFLLVLFVLLCLVFSVFGCVGMFFFGISWFCCVGCRCFLWWFVGVCFVLCCFVGPLVSCRVVVGVLFVLFALLFVDRFFFGGGVGGAWPLVLAPSGRVPQFRGSGCRISSKTRRTRWTKGAKIRSPLRLPLTCQANRPEILPFSFHPFPFLVKVPKVNNVSTFEQPPPPKRFPVEKNNPLVVWMD